MLLCSVTRRQQIRVSDALVAVAHPALYVADSELGISYHARAVSPLRRVHPDVQYFSHQISARNLQIFFAIHHLQVCRT